MNKPSDIYNKPSVTIEELARRRFTPEGKAERVTRALAALHDDQPIRLKDEQWKWVAENPDLEEQG